MIESGMTSVVWMMAIASSLMAGTYFTFSMVIMPSLELLPNNDGARVMNAINRKILKTGFMPLFFGSTLLSILMVGLSIWQWEEPTSVYGLVGGLVYFIGMFVVTAAGNVPLNNQLDIAETNAAQLNNIWNTYLTDWTRWNTVRAVACSVTLVICIALV